MLVLGIDPDLHTTGWAAYDSNLRKVIAVGCLKVPRKLTGFDAIEATMVKCRSECWGGIVNVLVVEGQELYLGNTKNTRSILDLALCAGALMGTTYTGSGDILCPKPAEWKGQVPKYIHHKRILDGLGVASYRVGVTKSTFAILPEKDSLHLLPDGDRLKNGDWKHVTDAIGLAIWGAEKIKHSR
jgi:hypothetical protein